MADKLSVSEIAKLRGRLKARKRMTSMRERAYRQRIAAELKYQRELGRKLRYMVMED